MTPTREQAEAAARRMMEARSRIPSRDNERVLADALTLAAFVLAGDTSLEAGSDSAWPVREVLRALADAADHLLREHDCDCLGWETIEAARQAAVELQARPPAGDTERLRAALVTEEADALFRRAVQATRDADEQHLSSGGGTRHWMRECFLPSLEHHGLALIDRAALAEGGV